MPPPLPACLNSKGDGDSKSNQVNEISDADVAQKLLDEFIFIEDVRDGDSVSRENGDNAQAGDADADVARNLLEEFVFIEQVQDKSNSSCSLEKDVTQDGDNAQPQGPNNDYRNDQLAPMDQQETSRGDQDYHDDIYLGPGKIEEGMTFYRKLNIKRQTESENYEWNRLQAGNDSEYDLNQGPSRFKWYGPLGGESVHDRLRLTFHNSEINGAQIADRPQLSFTTNMLPNFDPMSNQQSIFNWIDKVEECASIYNWPGTEILHYALPKLSGVAKTWYETQPTVIYSWPEWKKKLIQAFPTRQDYAQVLKEMLDRRVYFGESLIQYYIDKIGLLNRCRITGSKAVDCLIHGIDDTCLRMSAREANLAVPEDVLMFLQTMKFRYELLF